MNWKKLSTNDKAGLISLFVKNGITDLNQMRKLYANGGDIRSYSDWKKKIKEYKGLDIDNDNTYDYRGFYNENPERAYKLLEESPDAHFTDKYKTPLHETFSDESMYSNKTTKGGHWVIHPNNIEEFQHSDYTMKHPYETNRYLEENNPNVFATYKGGVVLNPAIVTANKYDKGGDKATLNNPRYNKGAEDRIYAYLRDEGLSHNQASAFMGNIAVESLLNADINQEKKGPAKGLLQTESDRYKKLQQYNEVPYKFGTGLTPDEQHQLDYFINKGVKNYTSGEWGRKGYNGKKYKSARDARIDFNNPNRSAQELSDILMKSYFRPGKPQEWRRDKMTDYYDKKMPTRFPYRMDEWGQYYYDKELKRYDVGGPINSQEVLLLDEDGGVPIQGSIVSTTLSRDQWNNLYRQNKVKLTDIPRKYQPWIEAENSQYKRDITNTIDKVGPIVTDVLGGSMGLAALLGSSPIWAPYVGSTIIDAGKTALNLYNPEAYATAGVNMAKGIASKLGPQALAKVSSIAPTIHNIGKGAGIGMNLYFGKEGLENIPHTLGEYSNIYNNEDDYLNKMFGYAGNTLNLGLDALNITGGVGAALQLGSSVLPSAVRTINNIGRKTKALGKRVDKFIHFNDRANKLSKNYFNQYSTLDDKIRENYNNQTNTINEAQSYNELYFPEISYTTDYLEGKPQERKVSYTSKETGDVIEGTFLEQIPIYKSTYTQNKFGKVKETSIYEGKNQIPFYVSGDTKVADRVYKDFIYKNSIIGEDGLQAGSSAVYSIYSGPANTGTPADSEILTTKNRLTNLSNKLGMYNTKQTSTVLSGDSKKIKGKVEIEVIEEGSNSNTSKGTVAEELYHLLYPSEYQKLLRMSAVDVNGKVLDKPRELEIPMSPEDLFQAFKKDPQLMRMKTILDNIKSGKGKHNSRILTILNETPSDVDRVIDILGEGYFGKDFKVIFDKSLSNIDFTNKAANEEFLKNLGLPKSWASEPEKMKTLYKTWKFQQSATTRGVRDVKGENIEEVVGRLLQNFATAHGAGGGGNTVQNSKYGGGSEYSYNGIQGIIYTPISYKENTFTNVMDAYKAVERQNINNKTPQLFNNNQSSEEIDLILKEVNSLLGSSLDKNSSINDVDNAITSYQNNLLKRNITKDNAALVESTTQKVSELLDLPSIRNNKEYYNVGQDVEQGGYVGRFQGKTDYYTFTGNYVGSGEKSRLEPGGLFPNSQNSSEKQIRSVIPSNEVKANLKIQRDNIRQAIIDYQNGSISREQLPEDLRFILNSKELFEQSSAPSLDDLKKVLDNIDRVEELDKELSILKQRRINTDKYNNKVDKLKQEYNNLIDNIRYYSTILGGSAVGTGTIGGLIYRVINSHNKSKKVFEDDIRNNPEKYQKWVNDLDSWIAKNKELLKEAEESGDKKKAKKLRKDIDFDMSTRMNILSTLTKVKESNEEQQQDNKYATGGPLKSDTADTFLTDWYSSPTTQSMIHQIEEQNGLPQSDINKEVQIALETPQYEIYSNNTNNSVPLDVLKDAAGLGRSYYQTPKDAVKQFRQASKEERKALQRINFSNAFNNIPDFGAIYTKMNGNPFILYKEGMFNPSNSIHEIDHNIQQLIPATLDTVVPVEHKLNEGIKSDYYLDSPNEIRSRIMQLRQINNLSPEKRDYNKKDAKKFIGKVKDKQLKRDLERMDYQTVANYLNYMADNSTYTFNPYLT